LGVTLDLLMPSLLELARLVPLPVCDVQDRILVKDAIRDGSNVSTRNQTREPSQGQSKKQA